MVLVLSPPQKLALQRWAREGYPHECCGLLLGRAENGSVHVHDVLPARNLNTERARDRYELDPQDLLRADEIARARHLDVVGVWHTHPDHPAQPSQTDLEQAWDGWSYLIVSVDSTGVQAMRSWRLRDGDFVEEALT